MTLNVSGDRTHTKSRRCLESDAGCNLVLQDLRPRLPIAMGAASAGMRDRLEKHILTDQDWSLPSGQTWNYRRGPNRHRNHKAANSLQELVGVQGFDPWTR